jgi:hypothetical protein
MKAAAAAIALAHIRTELTQRLLARMLESARLSDLI